MGVYESDAGGDDVNCTFGERSGACPKINTLALLSPDPQESAGATPPAAGGAAVGGAAGAAGHATWQCQLRVNGRLRRTIELGCVSEAQLAALLPTVLSTHGTAAWSLVPPAKEYDLDADLGLTPAQTALGQLELAAAVADSVCGKTSPPRAIMQRLDTSGASAPDWGWGRRHAGSTSLSSDGKVRLRTRMEALCLFAGDGARGLRARGGSLFLSAACRACPHRCTARPIARPTTARRRGSSAWTAATTAGR